MKHRSTPTKQPPDGRPAAGPACPKPLVVLLALGAVLGLIAPGLALGGTYTITPEADGNRVVFESHAPMESFEGSTSHIKGRIELNPDALTDSITVDVTVELATLDTGIGLRNTHMRENHLHTDTFPHAVFRGATLTGTSPRQLGPGEPVLVNLEGSFSLHGVTRRLAVPVELTLREDGSLEARTKFDVYLADYDIPRPKMLFMKLDEKQTVTFHVRAEAS